MNDHKLFMSKCIALGIESMQKGNPPVGALVVKKNVVIGSGLELAKSLNDITKHAEIEAVKDALKNGLQNLEGCTLYTTHEPCVMCSYVLRSYKIGMLVFGTSVEHVGGVSSEFKIMNTDAIPNWSTPPILVKGILEEECQTLSKSYTNLKTEQKHG